MSENVSLMVQSESLSQETIVVLKEGLEAKLGNRDRRRKLLESTNVLDIEDGSKFPDPVALIREDRESKKEQRLHHY